MNALELELIDRLCANGYEAVIVGGYVRDTIMGRESSDIDIATSATPEQIATLFDDKQVLARGKSFLVTHVDGVEIATYRKDEYHGGSAKNCKITQASSLAEDLVRRDLTMNAMAMCHRTGDIIDLHNGRFDAEKAIIKFVGDPEQTILDDPDRILRACRFLAIMEGEFDPDTLSAIKKYAHMIDTHVENHRIRIEILKTMKKAKSASIFFEILHEIGALQYIFPSMAKCCGHPHGNHHIEDIFEHLLLTGDYVSCKYPLLKLAAYLHDVGKPFTYDTSTKQFISHEKVGSSILENELRILHFTNDEIAQICGIVRTHMYVLKQAKKRGVRRLNHKLFELGIHPDDWFRMRLADHHGNIKNEPPAISEIKKQFMKLNSIGAPVQLTVKNLAISGGDIITMFGIQPGPKIGEIQRELFSHVIDGDLLNERDVLVQYIKDNLI
jgi:tRNA nucleotidyltransferase/poly(A) polymerase